MDYLLLKTKFLELTERLDLYYERRLKKEPKAKDNLENYKNDLLQNLAQEVYSKYNRDTYESYNPEAFIMLKAKKVWIDFTRVIKRQTMLTCNTPIDTLPENYSTESFHKDFENREAVIMIKRLLCPKEFELLELRAKGYSYEEIEGMTTYLSANAAKTGFNRIKKFIKLRFRRP